MPLSEMGEHEVSWGRYEALEGSPIRRQCQRAMSCLDGARLAM
jgi:hypothetical protein